jgi:hypothetical protein
VKCEKCGGVVLLARHETTGELLILDGDASTYEVLRPGPGKEPSGINPIVVSDKCPGLLKPGGIHGEGCRATHLPLHRCPGEWTPERIQEVKDALDQILRGPREHGPWIG